MNICKSNLVKQPVDKNANIVVDVDTGPVPKDFKETEQLSVIQNTEYLREANIRTYLIYNQRIIITGLLFRCFWQILVILTALLEKIRNNIFIGISSDRGWNCKEPLY